VIRKSSVLKTGVIVSCVLLCSGAAPSAQGTSAPQAAEDTPKAARQGVPNPTQLKVQLVVSRYLGEKKVSSLPYLLWVTVDDHLVTNLRMGVDVPVATIVFGGGTGTPGTPAPAQSYSYRNVGTSIDCSAIAVTSAFKVTITLSDSSIQFDPKQGTATAAKAGIVDAPAFRTFTSKFSIVLRDGQTAQYTSATDPISGEILKVDVTLNVVK
jgi:hypothetical protein